VLVAIDMSMRPSIELQVLGLLLVPQEFTM